MTFEFTVVTLNQWFTNTQEKNLDSQDLVSGVCSQGTKCLHTDKQD